MISFTKRKFLEQSRARQHKRCAVYLRLLFDQPTQDHFESYNQLQEWMELPTLVCATPKEISDAYHSHIQKAGVHLREHTLLPSVTTGDKKEGKPPFPIALYLDNLRSAHNVGSIVRTTEAFSLGTLYFSEKTPPLSHKQVRDTAMGADRFVTTSPFTSFDALPKPLIGLETSKEAVSLTEFLFPETFTLAIGNEEYGLTDETLSQVDYLLEIPLRGKKNSLNVANAFAIAAAEIARQREEVLHGA